MNRYITKLDETHYKLFSDFYVSSETNYDYFRNYLIIHSLNDQKKGNAQTYLCIQDDMNGNQTLLGYYSLRASSLIIEKDDFTKSGEPAVEIYEFAVKKDFQRKGIGSYLIKDAFVRIFEASESIGIKHILVCAKKDAVSYYQSYKFKQLPCHKEIPRNDDNEECIAMSVSLSLKN